MDWNRENGSCRYDNTIIVKGLLDGFMGDDQTYYLQQLQDKYRACQQLVAAFPINQSIESSPSDTVQAREQASKASQTFWQQIILRFKSYWQLNG